MIGFIKGFLTIFAILLISHELLANHTCYKVNPDYDFSALSIEDGHKIAKEMGVGVLRALSILRSIDMSIDQIRSNPQTAFEVCIHKNLLKPDELRKLAEKNYIVLTQDNDSLNSTDETKTTTASNETISDRYIVNESPVHSSLAEISSPNLIESGVENGLNGIERALVSGLTELAEGQKTKAAAYVLTGGAQAAFGAAQIGLGVCGFLLNQLQKSKPKK